MYCPSVSAQLKLLGSILVLVGCCLLVFPDVLSVEILKIVVDFLQTFYPLSSNVDLYFLGFEHLILGFLLYLCSMVDPESISDWFSGRSNVKIWTVLASLMYLPSLLLSQSAYINGEVYWWLWDDLMISLRYARNLAMGNGLVWNPGEYVEGYTNFLWTLYLSLLHLLPVPSRIVSLLVLVTNFLLFLGCIILIVRLVPKVGGGSFAANSSVGLFLLSACILHWTRAGTEFIALTFLFLLSLNLILKNNIEKWQYFSAYIFMGLLSLIRADAIILVSLLVIVDFFVRGLTPRLLALIVFVLIFPLSHFVFRWYYYGSFLPNTAHLKLYRFSDRLLRGSTYTLFFFARHSVLLALACLGFKGFKDTRDYLLFIILLFSGYIGWVGGDHFDYFRFFVPVLPVLIVLGMVEMGRRWKDAQIRFLLLLLTIITMPVIVPGLTVSFMTPKKSAIDRIKVGLYLKENTPEESTVAHTAAGNLFYFSRRRGIDLLGKVDPVVAQSVASHKKGAGHNKWNFSYSIGELQPDYVVTFLPETEEVKEWKEHRLEKRKEDPPIYYKQLYFYPKFQRNCLPYVLKTSTIRDVVRCKWDENKI